uniref:Uncharacterized protein n=1 Tax=Anopheles culicifacies TaxID=139723 RepID=A0A182M6T3_9DIPT
MAGKIDDPICCSADVGTLSEQCEQVGLHRTSDNARLHIHLLLVDVLQARTGRVRMVLLMMMVMMLLLLLLLLLMMMITSTSTTTAATTTTTTTATTAAAATARTASTAVVGFDVFG